MVGKLFGVPMEFYWFVLATVGAWVLLNRHRLGQNAYVTGDNAQAAGADGHPDPADADHALRPGRRWRRHSPGSSTASRS